MSAEKGVSYLIAFGNSNYVDFYDYHKCKNMHAAEKGTRKSCRRSGKWRKATARNFVKFSLSAKKLAAKVIYILLQVIKQFHLSCNERTATFVRCSVGNC